MKSKALVVLACITAPTGVSASSDGIYTNAVFPPNFPAAYKRYFGTVAFLFIKDRAAISTNLSVSMTLDEYNRYLDAGRKERENGNQTLHAPVGIISFSSEPTMEGNSDRYERNRRIYENINHVQITLPNYSPTFASIPNAPDQTFQSELSATGTCSWDTRSSRIANRCAPRARSTTSICRPVSPLQVGSASPSQGVSRIVARDVARSWLTPR